MPEPEPPEPRRSATQRFVLRLMPGRAAEIERESRSWILTCPHCGHERNYWDIGGVRYKASSSGKRVGLTCVACGRKGMHAVQRRPEA